VEVSGGSGFIVFLSVVILGVNSLRSLLFTCCCRCASSEVCGAGAVDAVAVLHELVGRDTFAALLLLNTAASFVAGTARLALLYMH
jgi:hypothetical protein